MAEAAPSARGLFAAMGRGGAGRPRVEGDFYPTVQAEPVEGLIRAEGWRLRDFAALWEPAAGAGDMARVLRRAGFRLRLSDIRDRGCGARVRDFFDYTRAPAAAMVTNPPFSEVNWAQGKGRWISHALETLGVEYMALLLSWSWPAAAGLGPLWSAWPPARVWLMRWRVDWTGAGAPPMLTAWFVWDRAAEPGPPALLMMDKPQFPDGELAPTLSQKASGPGALEESAGAAPSTSGFAETVGAGDDAAASLAPQAPADGEAL